MMPRKPCSLLRVLPSVVLLAAGATSLPAQAQQTAATTSAPPVSAPALNPPIMDVTTARAVLNQQVTQNVSRMQTEHESIKRRLAPLASGVAVPSLPALPARPKSLSAVGGPK